MTFRNWLRSSIGKRKKPSRPARISILTLEDRSVPSFGTPIVNVAGQGFSGVLPPDTVGDVGISHYVQATNDNSGTNIAIYNKDGTVAVPTFNLSTLAPPGSDHAVNGGNGDPIVVYDQLADRWLLSEFSLATNSIFIYISDTATPTANPADWTYWQVNCPVFPDYFKIAVWNDAYFIGVNDVNNGVYALDRNAMLTGSGGIISAIQRSTTDRPNWQRNHIMPADLEGFNLAPAGSPGIFVRQVDDEYDSAYSGGSNAATDYLEIWEFDPDFVTPASSTYSRVATVPIDDFDYILADEFGRNDLEQSGTSQQIDALPHYMMWRLTYRNTGAFESITGNFTHDVNEDGTADDDSGTATEQAGIRWFELRRTGLGAWTLYQEGDYQPDTNHRWMASLAQNGDGAMALGHSVTSSSMFPGIQYAGRQSGDALGSMPSGPHVMFAGTGAQTSSVARWGDYSAMSVDPVDDGTFWYTQEYGNASNTWSTRIGSFAFDDPNVQIYATSGSDSISVVNAAGNVEVRFGATLVKSMPFASLTSLTIHGREGSDTLTVDFTGGTLPPITFNGGGGTSDQMVLNGTGTYTTVTHTFTNANDGTVAVTGNGLITYTGLEPVDDNLSATDRVFTFNGGAETITLTSAGAGNTTIDSTLGESVTFVNPTGSLTVNAGSGSDTINVNSFGSGFTASLQIDGGAGTDTINHNANTTAESSNKFTSGGSITIPAGAPGTTIGPSNPFPSNIAVSGLSGTVSKVTVDLTGLSHTFPDDLDVLLVGPAGQTVQLMSDTGTSLDVVGVILTFDDTASGSLPDSTQIISGTYLPTDFSAGDTYSSPAPTGPYGTTLAGFNGTNPNGTWQLFIQDDAGSDIGTLTSWAVNITAGGSGVLAGVNYAADAISVTGSIQSTGSVILTADAIDLAVGSQIDAGVNAVTLQPQSTGQIVNLGAADAAGTLGLTDAELDRVTAGTLHLGNATSGMFLVSGTIDRAVSTVMSLTSGANIVQSLAGGAINTGGGTLLVTPTTNYSPQRAGNDVTASSMSFTAGSNMLINVTGATADTQYNQLNVAGTATLTGVDLVLNGGYSPAIGDIFTVVSATTRSGVFTGTADQSTLVFNTKTLTFGYTPTAVHLSIAPTASSVVRAGSTPTNAASVSWTVTFDQAVGGVSASNFTLVDGSSSLTGESISSVVAVAPDGNGRSNTWTVTASTGTGDGTLGLNLTSNTGVSNGGAANLVGGSIVGEVYTIDKTPATLLSLKPIVTGGNVVNVNLMALAANSKLPWQIIGFQAEFSEAVTGLTTGTLSGLAATGLTIVSPTIAQFAVATINSGTFTVGVNPVTDLAGNVGLLGTTSNTLSTHFGDVNGSGSVNNADLNAIRNVYLYGLPYNAFYDLNGDGIVDREDYNLARSRIGT